MAKAKNKIDKTKLLGFLYLLLFLVIIAFLIFNNKGIIKYIDLKGRIEKLNTQIEKSDNVIKKTESEIDSLKHDRTKIEKTAREKYNMRRKNEKGLDIKITK